MKTIEMNNEGEKSVYLKKYDIKYGKMLKYKTKIIRKCRYVYIISQYCSINVLQTNIYFLKEKNRIYVYKKIRTGLWI